MIELKLHIHFSIVYFDSMKQLSLILFAITSLAFVVFPSCENSEVYKAEEAQQLSFYPSSKPCTRWWWFATDINEEDIKHQLDWAKEHNFGGVEVAWVYPLYRYQRMYARSYGRNYQKDTSAQEWLSPEWSEIVAFTKAYSDSIGLSCDFTFGSAWPVAGSNITEEYTSKIYGDSLFRQTLTFAWCWPDTQMVINHLDSNAFRLFSEPVGNALQEALKGSKSALFTDSWEIKLNATNKIWTPGFDSVFMNKFGYDIIPYMEASLDSFPDVRYDYMLLLDEYVTEGFYKPYVRKCKELGAWSRVQCLASPTDVMTTYGLVDIPETESMLNNPNYSLVVSSAACLASKPNVSSETFTCMYGFPATYLRQEQTADLKMVADAMFAQGVNHHVYHGMPYNPKGVDSIDFFATTYFGPGGSLENELGDFNSYMEKVSGHMQKGRSYSEVAVYIPYEDGVMKGAYPPERQRVWVWGEYELRYIFPPEELTGHQPLWINRHYLSRSRLENGKLLIGDAAFSSLYVDVEYMDYRALQKVLELAQQGFPICFKNLPSQPGKLKMEGYQDMVREIIALPNVSDQWDQVSVQPPIISGDSIPDFWCRVTEYGDYLIFLAQPLAKGLEYPVYSGQSKMEKSVFRTLEFNFNGKKEKKNIEFNPYQSVLLKFSSKGEIEELDIQFVPEDPIVRERMPQRMHF